MKTKVSFIVIIFVFLFIKSYSQEPVREKLLPFLSNLPGLPQNGKDAFIKCQPDCNIEATVLKNYKAKISLFENKLKNMNPGNIDMNAYMSPGGTNTPTQTEIMLLQEMGQIGNAMQELLPINQNEGNVSNSYNEKMVALNDDVLKQINNCPQDKNDNTENPNRDKACVKSILENYKSNANELVLSYLKDVAPILDEYKKNLHLKFDKVEDLFLQVDYGKKAKMKSMGIMIFNMQGQIYASMENYSTMITDVWTKTCSWQSDIEKIVNAVY